MVLGGSSRADHCNDADSQVDAVRRPLKRRGLSRFYSSKSQSFGNVHELVANPFSCSSLMLAKKAGDLLDGIRHDIRRPRPTKRPSQLSADTSYSLHRASYDGTSVSWDGACSSPLVGSPCCSSPEEEQMSTDSPLPGVLQGAAAAATPLDPWAEEICSALRYTQLNMGSQQLLPQQPPLPQPQGAPPVVVWD